MSVKRFIPGTDERVYTKVRKRLTKFNGTEAAAWAETGLWTIQEGLEGFLRHKDRAALQQARTAAVGLLAALDALLDNTA